METKPAEATGVAKQPINKPISLRSFFEQDNVKQRFAEMLGNRAPQFITSVLQITASNALLAKADANSVYGAAATAATLDLPLNNNLGFAYIVPYNTKLPDGTYGYVAQFQIGWKGFVQLAQRSGLFRTISATPICEGQLVRENPLTGHIFDFDAKTSDVIIGYASYFELLNGFKSTWYMSVDQVTKHGKKYSQTFKNNKGLWKDDFPAMALKTVIKLNLSKFAPLSIDSQLQRAINVDQAAIEGNNVKYIDAHEEIQTQANQKPIGLEQPAPTETETNDVEAPFAK